MVLLYAPPHFTLFHFIFFDFLPAQVTPVDSPLEGVRFGESFDCKIVLTFFVHASAFFH